MEATVLSDLWLAFFHVIALILERSPLLWSSSSLQSQETHSLLLIRLFSFPKKQQQQKNSISPPVMEKILLWFASDLIIFQPNTEISVYMYIGVSNPMAAFQNVGHRSKKVTDLQKSKGQKSWSSDFPALIRDKWLQKWCPCESESTFPQHLVFEGNITGCLMLFWGTWAKLHDSLSWIKNKQNRYSE